MADKKIPSSSPFTDKKLLNRLLDEKGIAEDSDWRAFFNCLLIQQQCNHLTDQQKNDLRQLTDELLEQNDFSAGHLQKAFVQQNRVLNAPSLEQLQEAIAESEDLLQEFRQLSIKRTGEVARLENSAITTIQNNAEPSIMIKQLRIAFRSLIDMMKTDTDNLERLCKTDQLTGLGNRRYFDQFLQRKIDLFTALRPLSLLMLDIDYFKKFNDSYGHRIGDQALSTVAKIISAHMQQEKLGESGLDYLVVRYGGEEFAIVLYGVKLEEAVRQAEIIRDKIESYSFVIRNIKGKIIHRDINISVCIGVSTFNPAWTDATAERLVEAADRALYQAKADGRNLVRF
ncbi:MAG: GGDEF domain-containing protein [Proteobacteria bacterium]|nr:GGDEF domain-containing protein [Pseudomonadota bacterium]